MPNTYVPTQLGFQPTGVKGEKKTSTLFLGRIVSGEAPYDGPGFGANGRPDYLQTLVINMASGPRDIDQWGTITINVSDLVDIWDANQDNYPENLNLTFKEVSVCETDDDGNTIEKKMIILGSQTYLPAES